MTTKLTIRAEQRPLWLCFEPWANEYTVPAGATVVISFSDDQTPVELVHQPDGIIFLSLGCHPDIWTEEGEPLWILSDVSPRTPRDVSMTSIRAIMGLVPPIRTEPGPARPD